jgi:hypothetical protein
MTLEGLFGLCLIACAVMLVWGIVKKLAKLVIFGGVLLVVLALLSSGELGALLGF